MMFNISLKRKNDFFGIILWGIFLYILMKFVLFGVNVLPFSPDSWGYWELSKTIFSDNFYKVHAIRQFQIIEDHAMSFPPLWPVIIAISNIITKAGPAIMPIMAGIFTILSVIILEVTFRQNYHIKYLGLLGGFVLLSDPSLVSEITAGRSIPLASMLISIMLYLWFKPFVLLTTLKLGLISGLLILTRFDMIPFILLFGFAVYMRESHIYFNKVNFKFILLFYIITILIISPYILYSLEYFNVLLASDNSIVAKSAYKIFTTYYSINPLITIFDEPIIWLERIVANTITFVSVRKKLWLIILLTIIMLLVLKNLKKIDSKVQLFIIYLLIYSSSLFTYIASGFYDERYFSFLIMFMILFNIISFRSLIQNIKYSYLFIPSILIYLVVLLIYYPKNSPAINFHLMSMSEKIEAKQLDKVYLCKQKLNYRDKVMFSDANDAGMVSSFFSIYTTRTPSNFNLLSNEEKQNFLSKYSIKAYYGPSFENLFKGSDNLSFETCKYNNNFIYIKDNK